MMIVRRYELIAKQGQLSTLLAALDALAAWLMRRDGCNRIEIEQDSTRHDVITFSEYWRDEEARLATGIEVSRALLARIFSNVENVDDTKAVQIHVYQR